jgi:hypothetical protein
MEKKRKPRNRVTQIETHLIFDRGDPTEELRKEDIFSRWNWETELSISKKKKKKKTLISHSQYCRNQDYINHSLNMTGIKL